MNANPFTPDSLPAGPWRNKWALVMLLAVPWWPMPGRSADFIISARGQPRAEIILTNWSEPPLIFAAAELQRYVKTMSGAELPVLKARSDLPAIVLSTLGTNRSAWPDPREEDRYRLAIDGRTLRIEGASPRAVLFGVYDLLERLGCGWCVPGDEVVPRKDTLVLPPLQVETRPAFQYRMMLDFPLMTVAQSLAIVDWIAKNRMNWVHACPNAHGEPTAWYDRRARVVPQLINRGLRLLVGGHTMHTWMPETEFAAHPDWFAYAAGERKPRSLCITHPEMTAALIRNMQRFLTRCPEVDVVDLWHPDGEAFCHCSRCTRGLLPEGAKTNSLAPAPADAVKAAYGISHVEFLNRVADAIGRSHPKVLLGPLIYNQTDRAMPDGCPDLADNVLLGLAHISRDSYRPLAGEPKSAINGRFLGNDLTWMARAKHSYVYEYYNGWVAPYLYPGAQIIVKDLQTLAALHVQGASSDMYGYSPVNMYVAARALWSPDLSWQDLVRDFCRRYYGDVGEAMAENELALETGIYGLSGYQSSGARDPEKWATPPEAGLYLQRQRPAQIAFLEKQIAQTRDPQVRARLQRVLLPWSKWDKEQRFWAFPEFRDPP